MRIYGETVSVSLRIFQGQDEYGNDIEEYSKPFDVEDVLVGKPSTDNRIESGQPYAIESDKRFCFPKGFDKDMRGALITRGSSTYKVIGEPMAYTDANIPAKTPWNMVCEAVRFDG